MKRIICELICHFLNFQGLPILNNPPFYAECAGHGNSEILLVGKSIIRGFSSCVVLLSVNYTTLTKLGLCHIFLSDIIIRRFRDEGT